MVIDPMKTKQPPKSLDELDMLLINELGKDARQPVRALARNVGVNRETVRYRMNRLISEGILKIICVCNAERLGYQYKVMIGVKVRPGMSDTAASQLADLSGVMAVQLAANYYNIMVWGIFRDRTDFARFISKDLSGISGASSIETMHLIYSIKEFWKFQDYETDHAYDFSRDRLNELDLSVIKAMRLNPRQTITELADSIGCSRSAAKATLDKNIDDGVIGFFPLVDPSVLGYGHWAVTLIRCEPDKVSAVVNALSRLDAILHVSLITGKWQISTVALFQDINQMYDFISKTLASIPDITGYANIPLLGNVKFEINYFFDWLSLPLMQ